MVPAGELMQAWCPIAAGWVSRRPCWVRRTGWCPEGTRACEAGSSADGKTGGFWDLGYELLERELIGSVEILNFHTQRILLTVKFKLCKTKFGLIYIEEIEQIL